MSPAVSATHSSSAVLPIPASRHDGHGAVSNSEAAQDTGQHLLFFAPADEHGVARSGIGG
jgi:hypothetical protein